MSIFNFFKKEKPSVKLDYTLYDLKLGFIVDYFLKTWEVKKVYIYDWGNNCYSRLYFLHAGNESMYLNVEDDDERTCSIWKTINISEIVPDLIKNIRSNDDCPTSISYNNATFVLISSNLGHAYEENHEDDFYELINWTYQNVNSKELISIDRIGEEEFECSFGQFVQEYEFSNILPR